MKRKFHLKKEYGIHKHFNLVLKGSEGEFPSCICPEGKIYVHELDECVEVDRSKCPLGSKKVDNKCVCENVNEFKYEFDEIFWICRPWYETAN